MSDAEQTVGASSRVQNKKTGVTYTVLDFSLDNILLESDPNFGREREIIQTCDSTDERNAFEQLVADYDIIDEPAPAKRIYCDLCGVSNADSVEDAIEDDWSPMGYLTAYKASVERQRQIGPICPHCVEAFFTLDSNGELCLNYPPHHPHAEKPEGVEVISH